MPKEAPYSLVAMNHFLDKLERRREECKSNGHKSPAYLPFVPCFRNDQYVIKGSCAYCLAYIERPLNEQELEGLRRFRLSLNESINV